MDVECEQSELERKLMEVRSVGLIASSKLKNQVGLKKADVKDAVHRSRLRDDIILHVHPAMIKIPTINKMIIS